MSDETPSAAGAVAPASIAAPATLAPAPSTPEQAMDNTMREAYRAATQARDDRGRFAPGSPEAIAEAAAAPAEAPAAPAATETPAPAETASEAALNAVPEPAGPLSDPPKSWKPEARERWGKLPLEDRAYIVQREAEMQAGVARIQERYRPIEEVLRPRAQALAQEAGSVDAGLNRLFQISDYASRDPVSFVREFAANRGIDLAALAQQAPMPTADQPQQFADPVARQELAQMKQYVQQIAQERAAVQEQQLTTEISRMEADTARYPMFAELRPMMADKLRRGEATTLSDAYQLAVAPFAKVLTTAQQAERVRAEEARRQADQARIASLNVRTGGPSYQAEPQSMEATIRAAYRQAMT